MKVGFLGAGTVTGTFGRHLITAGHTIVLSNSRGPATLAYLSPILVQLVHQLFFVDERANMVHTGITTGDRRCNFDAHSRLCQQLGQPDTGAD